MVPELTILTPDDAPPRRIVLKALTTIGRAPHCDVRLDDETVSPGHAEIRRRSAGCFVADVGSLRGTFLNGLRVQLEHRLADGDVISLGDNRLVFREHRADRRAPERLTAEMPVVESPVTPEPTPTPTPPPRRTPPRLTAVTHVHNAVERLWSATVDGHRATAIDVTKLKKENQSLGVLTHATSALLAPEPLPDLLEKILDLTFKALPAERGAIVYMEGNPPRPVVKAAKQRRGHEPIRDISPAFAERVTRDRTALLLRDVREDPTATASNGVTNGPIRSAICTPIWIEAKPAAAHKVRGLMYFDARGWECPFDEEHLQVLTVLGNIAATKIENARLVEDLVFKRRLEEDMRLAAKIQTNLLPKAALDVPGYDVSGDTVAYRMVGGDYYDWALEGNVLHLALGDVSGKGLGAAMLMVALRAAARAHWRDGKLSDATARINRTFLETVPDEQFATFFIARLDVLSGRLVYVNAGHNRPLLVRADGAVEVLREAGMVVGLFDDITYPEGRLTMEPGDTLLLFSDGVSDTWPDSVQADRQMAELVRRHSARGAQALQDEIFRHLDRMAGPRPNDDSTVVVLKRKD
jgi:sigma-B regulation protein RsbU (phosphoserine phosphatase)